jgi:CRISPR-associated protein Cas1
MGFIPQLGFVHDAGMLPFIYDIADLYKHETSWPAAFQAMQQDPLDDGTLARQFLKERVEETKLLQRMPRDLIKLFEESGKT